MRERGRDGAGRRRGHREVQGWISRKRRKGSGPAREALPPHHPPTRALRRQQQARAPSRQSECGWLEKGGNAPRVRHRGSGLEGVGGGEHCRHKRRPRKRRCAFDAGGVWLMKSGTTSAGPHQRTDLGLGHAARGHSPRTPVDEPGRDAGAGTRAQGVATERNAQKVPLAMARASVESFYNSWGSSTSTHPNVGRSNWSRWHPTANAKVFTPHMDTLRAVT